MPLIIGTPQADTLLGGIDNDTLEGLGGDDTLRGGLGNDTLDGGADFDLVDYALATGPVNVSLAQGIALGADGRDTLLSIEDVLGSAFGDDLVGDDSGNAIRGGAGNDTLEGRGGDDTLIGGGGVDTVSYGSAPAAVRVDLAQLFASGGAGVDTLLEIERVVGSDFNDTLSGDGSANHISGGKGHDVITGDAGNDTLWGGQGNDSADGRSGVDTAVYGAARVDYVVSQTAPGAIMLSHRNGGADGIDVLLNIEHLVFSDRMLAFGDRALEVERVAFVLWTPGIAGSRDLFAKGVSFYDNGYSFDFLCEIALNYHPESGRALAQKLLTGTPGTSSSLADVEAVMATAGGGSTLAGRVAAVKLMALDVATLANIDLAGLRSQGVECSLVVDGVQLFGGAPAG